jgi:hypothetical protein
MSRVQVQEMVPGRERGGHFVGFLVPTLCCARLGFSPIRPSLLIIVGLNPISSIKALSCRFTLGSVRRIFIPELKRPIVVGSSPSIMVLSATFFYFFQTKKDFIFFSDEYLLYTTQYNYISLLIFII